ncbi:molybdenum cofactor biosynthesis protein MoaE [Thermosulfuriphilus sp.]
MKSFPNIHQAGMILVHNGIVRASSRDGRSVVAVRVKVNREPLARLLEAARRRPGIVAVEAEIREGELTVGEDLMYLVIAGDFRENVISCLAELLEAIKTEVTEKEEVFGD